MIVSNYDYFNLSDSENDSHRRMDFSVYLPPCVSSDYRPDYLIGIPGTDEGIDPEYIYDVIPDSGRTYYYEVDSDGNVEVVTE